jgi:inward rectifier potassium channel
MVRIANGRASLLVDATVRLSALIAERSHEGQVYRRIHDLHLLRSHIPMFALTWTLMHEIDEKSPLRHFDLDRLGESDLRLFLSVTARDLSLAAEVYDMKDYGPADVVSGMRYADAVSIDDHGNTIADLRRISLLETDTGTNFSTAAAA